MYPKKKKKSAYIVHFSDNSYLDDPQQKWAVLHCKEKNTNNLLLRVARRQLYLKYIKKSVSKIYLKRFTNLFTPKLFVVDSLPIFFLGAQLYI